jgi:hypothetical protein
MLYFGRAPYDAKIPAGGPAIADVLRQAWSRLIRKQWLILYPLALSVLGTLAFFAVYAAAGGTLTLSAFFNADFERWGFVREHFFTSFSFAPQLAVAVAAGTAFCALAAMIQAPFYRAIAGARYPLAPRGWSEAGRLFVFYLALYAVTRVLPLAVPAEGIWADLVFTVATIFALMVVFADYVIVFENAGPLRGVRRSLRLVGLRFAAVIVIFVLLELVFVAIGSLYGLYYRGTGQVFVLLPISRMLVESLVLLCANLVLVFLYEDTRRMSPA